MNTLTRLSLRGLSIFFMLGDALSAETKQPTYREVLIEHFEKWDQDGDGCLTPEEAETVVESVPCRGDAAVAIVVTHIYFEDHPEVKSLILDQWNAPPRGDRAKKLRGRLEFEFRTTRDRVQSIPRKLFADGSPTLAGIEQGPLGDCFFIAAVGACVYRKPQSVRNIFQIHADGSYDVCFPGSGTKAHFDRVPIDKQLALTSSGKEGCWLSSLEIAAGRKYNLKARKEVQAGKKEKKRAVERIGSGGQAKHALQLLTGKKYISIWPEGLSDWATTRQWLSHMHGSRMIATVGLHIEGKVPRGLGSKHAYAILDYLPDREMLYLWNPWGDDHDVTNTGWEQGYTRRKGRFWIPLAHLERAFYTKACKCRFDFQTNQDITPGKWNE